MDLLFSQGLAYEALPLNSSARCATTCVRSSSSSSRACSATNWSSSGSQKRSSPYVTSRRCGTPDRSWQDRRQAAGLLLAQKILQDAASENAAEHALNSIATSRSRTPTTSVPMSSTSPRW